MSHSLEVSNQSDRLDELRNTEYYPLKVSGFIATKILLLSKKLKKGSLISAFFVIVKPNDLLVCIYIGVDSKGNNRSLSCVSDIQIIDNWDIAINDINSASL